MVPSQTARWRAAVGLSLAAACGLGTACAALSGISRYDNVDCVSDCGKDSERDTRPLPVDSPSCTDAGGTVVQQCSDTELARNDRSATTDLREIVFPDGDREAPYTPNCMIIRAGQTVTWRGNFGAHPLIARDRSTLPNPIPTIERGVEAGVQFSCPGYYNFSCRNHGDFMLGTIQVVP